MKSLATVVLGVIVGIGSVRLLMLVVPEVLRSPVLQRSNYRGKVVPTAGGLLVVLAVLLIEGARLGLGAIGLGKRPGLDGTRPLVLLACIGFGFLGLLDDVLAVGGDEGFGGHLRALARGRVTTGFVKLAGGGALALVLASAPGPEGRLRLLADAALIALAANLGNLLDRRPGRAVKCGIVAWIPLVVLAGGDALSVALAPVMGAFAAILPDDLGERLMIGDVGANVLGAVLGFGVVLEAGFTARLAVLAALLALNLVSEWVSFSSVIDRVQFLRRVDELGRIDP
jgi:UDP-N-acetylmuramyl pentapeptide phosphotransferase/UDP-N-acetylglucosamine-1-phosphate transferase